MQDWLQAEKELMAETSLERVCKSCLMDNVPTGR
jgi:hypothetical protein